MPASLAAVFDPVATELRRELDERLAQLIDIDPGLEPLGLEIRRFVENGGKRLRPAFVYWGHRATGAEHDPAAITAGAAVELLHGFALIQDDVMDRATRRRGAPTVHEVLAERYRRGGLRSAQEPDTPLEPSSGRLLPADPAWFGFSAAILASDLTVAWATELLARADVDPRLAPRVRRLFADLRVEVIGGQYLDLRLSGLPDATADDALRVALLKSGRYTVTRPLQLGATVAGASPGLLELLAVYGDAIGTAFQLRDDVLGLFGDPATTGKSAVGDLREGKRTLLVIAALERSDPSQRSVLTSCLGNPDVEESDADRVRQIVRSTGTLAHVEGLAAQRQDRAIQVLDEVPEPARSALAELAELVVARAT